MGTGGGAGMPLLSSDWCCSVAIKWISFFSTLLFNFSSTSDMTVIKKNFFFVFNLEKRTIQMTSTHDEYPSVIMCRFDMLIGLFQSPKLFIMQSLHFLFRPCFMMYQSEFFL